MATDYLNTSLPAISAEEVTPNDAADLTDMSRAIYVGTGGDLTVVMEEGQTVTFANVPDGTLLPLRVSRVMEASTATDIVAIR